MTDWMVHLQDVVIFFYVGWVACLAELVAGCMVLPSLARQELRSIVTHLMQVKLCQKHQMTKLPMSSIRPIYLYCHHLHQNCCLSDVRDVTGCWTFSVSLCQSHPQR